MALYMAHILVVDDNEMVRRIVGHVLETAGYEVGEACNGAEAMEALRLGPADMVLTDLHMPGMGGQELLGRVRSAFPDLPCAAMSGQDKGKGFDGFIQKPFEIDDLLLMLNGILDLHGKAVRPESLGSQPG